MPDNSPPADTLDINATIARLTELEAERDGLVSQLRNAGTAIGEVLSCYAPAPPKRGRPKKDAAPATPPKKRGRPRKVKPEPAPVAEP